MKKKSPVKAKVEPKQEPKPVERKANPKKKPKKISADTARISNLVFRVSLLEEYLQAINDEMKRIWPMVKRDLAVLEGETKRIAKDFKDVHGAFVEVVNEDLRESKKEVNRIAKTIREELHSNVRTLDARWAALRDRVQAHENAVAHYKDLNETRNKNIFERLAMLSDIAPTERIEAIDMRVSKIEAAQPKPIPVLTPEQIELLRGIMRNLGA